MDASLLDRPVWASLATCHAHLAVGDALARRYADDINLFASARDDSDEALQALAALVPADRPLYVLQVPGIRVPPGCIERLARPGVQMIAVRPQTANVAHAWVDLGDDDAPEMLALAQLTQPGPFLARTHAMGRFIGVRVDGRLAAMVGERMRMPGHTEISAVCTHPEFRGRGYARALSSVVAARIQARGEQPFLHAWADNHAAIALYESMGFALRSDVNAMVIARA